MSVFISLLFCSFAFAAIADALIVGRSAVRLLAVSAAVVVLCVVAGYGHLTESYATESDLPYILSGIILLGLLGGAFSAFTALDCLRSDADTLDMPSEIGNIAVVVTLALFAGSVIAVELSPAFL